MIQLESLSKHTKLKVLQRISAKICDRCAFEEADDSFRQVEVRKKQGEEGLEVRVGMGGAATMRSRVSSPSQRWKLSD